MNKKVIAVVPMKLNSQRLKNKNIKSFSDGKPLCNFILNTLKKVSGIDEIYVYCSDERIKDYIPEGIKYLKRSESLDRDVTKINEVLLAFANDVDADVYVMAHTTAPFISSESIQKGVNAVVNEDYDSSFSAKKLQDFFWLNGKPMNYSLDAIPRTQDLDPLFMETSGFYAYKKNVIVDMNRRIGNNPFIVEVGEIESVDIDEEEDFIIADAIHAKLGDF